jgi:hypothetical protein
VLSKKDKTCLNRNHYLHSENKTHTSTIGKIEIFNLRVHIWC